jgi:predicted Zn-dependent protease
LKLVRAAVYALSALLVFQDIAGSVAVAQGAGPSLLRDSEIENTLKVISTPLFKAAGLNTDNVHAYVVNDKSLNAFVAVGQNVFVNSGLVTTVRNANELIGVIAHETGHISGGHLARFDEGMKGATAIAILSMVLGAAAMAAGAGEAGAGIAMGGQEAAQRTVLAYSRDQESAADQAGLSFLNKTGQSGRGLVTFLGYLGNQEALMTKNKDPYVRSHPLSEDRVERLREAVEESPFADAPEPELYVQLFDRMRAKIGGYLDPPYVTFQKYPLSDKSLSARYARAYAYNQKHEIAKAMAEADSLIKDYPDDPYFRELKGFLLSEEGKVRESLDPYRKSIKLKDDEPLILTALGQALVGLEDPKLNDEAIRVLNEANRYDRTNPFTWSQLATAYYQAGNEGMAHLASAESFVLEGDDKAAGLHANQAIRQLKSGTPSWLRAQDILYIMRSNSGK